MSRRPLQIDCAGERLAATLDWAPGGTGLLIVTGGNEVRAGAWSGQAKLAACVAAAGFPVLRYDRRGVGDSEGDNRGFLGSRDDLAAALATFRASAPQLRRVVGFGNCDAASALMLFAAELSIDGLVLANPWAFDAAQEDGHAPAALRRRYRQKLFDPGEWRRLLTGGVDLRKLASGVRQAARTAQPSGLSRDLRAGLARFAGPVAILVAERDRTAQQFLSAWDPEDTRIRTLASASHSFAHEAARDWLLETILEALRSL